MNEPVKIPVSPGLFALVDADDAKKVMSQKWYVSKTKHHIYAVAKKWICSPNKYKRTLMHRLILDAPDGEIVDHINGDGLDNRRCNLRLCTMRQNVCNQRIRTTYAGKPTTSRYKGVTKDKRKRSGWVAQIVSYGNHIHIGTFPTELEAAAAYNAKAVELFGSFARLNEIPSHPAPHPTRQPTQEQEVISNGT